jgi:hypothetical protein
MDTKSAGLTLSATSGFKGRIMTIEKVFPSGAWRVCGVVEGESDHYFLERVYYGYTKREAVKLWNEQVREEAGE